MTRGDEGAITVFLSISILVLLILTAVIVEGSRIRIADLQGLRALEISGNSVLAGYNRQLKAEYGLFAVANADEGEIENVVREYFLKNLGTEVMGNGEAWSLYDYRVDELRATPQGSLNEGLPLKEQVLQLMKYRGIQSLGENFIDTLSLLSSTEGTLQTLDKKLEFERELQGLSELRQELSNTVETAASFSVQRQVELADEIYLNAVEISNIRAELEALEDQMDNLSISLQGASGSASEEIYNNLYKCSLRLQELQQRQADKANLIEQQLDALSKELELYLALNSKIQGLISDINFQRGFVETRFEEYKLETEKNSATMPAGVAEALMEEIKLYEALFSKEESEKLKNTAKQNETVLVQGASLLSVLKQKAFSFLPVFARGELLELNSLKEQYIETVSKYSTILNYSIPKAPGIDTLQDYTKEDNRAASIQRAREFLSDSPGGKDIELADEVIKLLPSYSNLPEISPSHEIEFDEAKDEGYTEASLSGKASIVSKIMSAGTDLRDSLFINEYILGIFNCYSTRTKPEEKSITGQYKKYRRSFFEYEVEYIIYGKPSQLQNLAEAKRDLLLTRFALNMVYIYTQPQLIKRASAIAAALSVPMGGASMPIIKTMIIAGWGMGYAVDDSKELLEGKEIPIFKNQAELKADYEDYLRLFLILRSTDTDNRLLRAMDLIQLNYYTQLPEGAAFTKVEFYSRLGLDVRYSIKYLFLNMPFVQREIGALDDRYNFNKSMWVGY